MREAVRQMLPSDDRGGHIVNVASVAVQGSWASQANYAASKAGILGLTRAAARVLGGKISVNAVAPGYTDTTLLDQAQGYETIVNIGAASGRVATSKEIANAIAFLASDTVS